MKSSLLLPIVFLGGMMPTGHAVQLAADPFTNGTTPADGEYMTGANNLVGPAPTIPGFDGAWEEAYNGAFNCLL